VSNSKTGQLTLTTPLSGKIFHRQVGLAVINQCTKFEVSRFTHYEAMNGGAECRKWCGLGWLGALKVMGNATIRCSAYDFLFNFNRNYMAILFRFSTFIYTNCLSKVANFNLPNLHLVPPLGVTPMEFCRDL